jgi:hypothetical protein
MTAVSRDQFEVDVLVVHHIPTRARFSLGSDLIDWGLAGQRLPNGDQYARDDVIQVALQILNEIGIGYSESSE